MDLKRAIQYNARQFERIVKDLTQDKQRELARPAAEMMQEAIRAKTPVADRTLFRYTEGGKGKGKRKLLAIYTPGNLKRSIQILDLPKSNRLFVGPVSKGGSTGLFRGDKVDGYYAVFVERITPFVRPAADAAETVVMLRLRKDAEAYMNKQISNIQ